MLMFCTFQAWLHNYLVYNTGIAAEPKNRAPFHNFYTNNTPCDIDTFFDISAIADLTFGELYGHFKTENAPFPVSIS